LRINNFMINISNTSGRAINILESECWYWYIECCSVKMNLW
jgi:hypothetical protein